MNSSNINSFKTSIMNYGKKGKNVQMMKVSNDVEQYRKYVHNIKYDFI